MTPQPFADGNGPRERALRYGAAALGDAELLAVLLGTGGPGVSAVRLAASVLERAGGLGALVEPRGLAEEPGVGPAKAARIAAALELGRRALLLRLDGPEARLGTFETVAAWAAPRLAALEHEEIWLLVLDGRHGLKAALRVGQGGLHGCGLTAGDVLRPALRLAASRIVLVHNHPSGDPTPSDEDIATTLRLAEAAELVGTPLIDHVVVGRDGAESILTTAARLGRLRSLQAPVDLLGVGARDAMVAERSRRTKRRKRT